MNLHLMIDLETLGDSPDAMVAEAGYAVFDPHQTNVEFFGSWHLNLEEQMFKREVNINVIQWWLKQNEAAREKIALNRDRVPVEEFLLEFSQLDWQNYEGVWSHGLAYDIPILTHLFKQYHREVPWHFWVTRDTRTIFWLAKLGKTDLFVPEISHSAVHDAIAQARSIQKAFQSIEVTKK